MGAAGVMAAGTGLTGATSLLQFQQQRSAAEIQRHEAETEAAGIELGAKTREADRKARLAEALASQNAMAGAKGVAAFEGSPLTILEADIATEKEATERDIFQSRLAATSTRLSGRVRERMMKMGANIGLLSNVGRMATQAAAFRG